MEPEEAGGTQMTQALPALEPTERPPSNVIWIGSCAQTSSKKGMTQTTIKIAVIDCTNVFPLILPPPRLRPLPPTTVG
jgi:hypothetical protein